MSQYTLEEISKHSSANDLWIVYNGEVFDVTKFIEDHPGGEQVLLENAGQDATQNFDDVGHSANANSMMQKYKIGTVKGGVVKKVELKKPSQTSSSKTDKPKKDNKSNEGGLGLLKIPIIILVLAVIAYLFMGSDALIENDE
ncbi:cytochrome b5 A [Tieghemostelium lacteum]|uniref:Cytochrome b5 A n=1 Tax=Tieghemostelium lacteum TaxID=361077 RepID=A0A151ZBI0_TIELA|nr:cytochrome b5 A [Tieghemostelium lacteum]|eukprot:KYQ91307.1 cytochrome b5 A [Tieghemostelium lacteum]